MAALNEDLADNPFATAHANPQLPSTLAELRLPLDLRVDSRPAPNKMENYQKIEKIGEGKQSSFPFPSLIAVEKISIITV